MSMLLMFMHCTGLLEVQMFIRWQILCCADATESMFLPGMFTERVTV